MEKQPKPEKTGNDRIIEQYSIKCPYCQELIKGYGIGGAESNYQTHLWRSHGILPTNKEKNEK